MKKPLILLAALAASLATAASAQTPIAAQGPSADPLVEGFRLLETGSVADAIEQLYGVKSFMSHEMRPVQEEKFVGRAVTVQFNKEEHKDGSSAIGAMVSLLDSSPPGSVFVLGIEDGLDYGAIGGMMSTTMKVRGFTGAISDGGVRDLGQIRKLGFPVWGRSVVPSTTVNHYRASASNIPVMAGGVKVSPGDILVADADGIVVVPQDKAEAVLTKARELDYIEHATLPLIEKLKSLKQAIATFGRL